MDSQDQPKCGYSRLDTLVLQDTETGISFIVDAGGYHGFTYQEPGKEKVHIKNQNHIAFKLFENTECNLQLGENVNTTTKISISPFKKDQKNAKDCLKRLQTLLNAACQRASQHIENLPNKGGFSKEEINHLEKIKENTQNGCYATMSNYVPTKEVDAALQADEKHKKQSHHVTRDTNFSTPIKGQFASAFINREIITLDPEDKTITEKYNEFKNIFSSKNTNNVVEKMKTAYSMMSQLFPKHQLDNDLVQASKPVAITQFIDKKQGVCRHVALLGDFFIGKLVQDGVLPKGKVTHYRSTTLDLRSHTLVIYKPDSENVHYVIDYAQNIFERISNQGDLERCMRIYRENGLPSVLARFAEENKFNIPEIEKNQPLGERVKNTLEDKAEKDKSFSDILTNQNLRCPITGEVMLDPVKVNNNQTYERAALDEWRKKHNTCPMTRNPITTVEPNYKKKKEIFDLAVGEDGSGILPEEIYLADKDSLKPQTVKTKANISFDVALYDLKSHSDTFQGNDEIKTALGQLTNTLTPLAKKLKKNPTAETKKEFLTALHSEDRYLESDVTLMQVIKNIGLCVGLLGVGYLIAGAINLRSTGRFLFFAEQNESDKRITELYTGTSSLSI